MDNLTAEQVFAKIMLILRKFTHFYSAVYESVEKVEDNSIDTLAVTVDKLLYNREFVETRDIKEMVFVVLHELVHISLMHVIRRGDRDPDLYNVACDLYVNKLLEEEFELTKALNKRSNQIPIILPGEVLYSDSINTDKDCVESIYDRLSEQSKDNGFEQNGQGQFNIDNTGSNEKNNQRCKSKTVQITKDSHNEFINNGDDPVQQENDAKRLLSEIDTKLEMDGGNQCGTENMHILRKLMQNLLKSRLDWRKLLKKYCIQVKSSETSFAVPDKRMYYQRAIYPGACVNGTEQLENVKICIDTSGSISDRDLSGFIYQVSQILKYYKMSAEILCWDTTVQTAKDFSCVDDIVKSGLLGGGGTDVSSVFKYLDTKEKYTKPGIVLIFTDGYFHLDTLTSKWATKYKNTIWVMTSQSYSNFEPPFGKVAKAVFDE